MKAWVVYESHWGNTAAVAAAVADGIGAGARAVTTSEAARQDLRDADLLVAGAPVLGFRLPTDAMVRGLERESAKAPRPADLEHPTMRSWLESLPPASGLGAAFETALRWSPGGSTGAIARLLAAAGCRPAGSPRRFFVTGRYGPLREGELERARAWGEELARVVTSR